MKNKSSNNIQFESDKEITPIIHKIKNVLEKIVQNFYDNVKQSRKQKTYNYLKAYYLDQKDKKTIAKENGISVTGLDMNLAKFNKDCISSSDKREPYFADSFIKEIESAREKYIYTFLEQSQEEMGLEIDSQNYNLLRFLDLDVAKFNEDLSLIVPHGAILKFRDPMQEIIKELEDCFSYIEKEDLIKKLPKEITGEERNKIIDNLIDSWYKIEQIDNDKIRIRTDLLTPIYLRQARIIYDNDGPITSSIVSERYEKIYGENMPSLSSDLLKKSGFKANGTLWLYQENPVKLLNEVETYVSEHNFLVRLSELRRYFKGRNLPIKISSMETYLQEICFRTLDDPDLFCHKDHVSSHPELRFRKSRNFGQENITINAIWKYLKENGPKRINALKSWGKDFMIENNLNKSVFSQIIKEYCEDYDVLINENGIIKINPKYSEEDVKYLGLGKSKEKYAQTVISITINSLRKANHNRLYLSELLNLIWATDVKQHILTRKKIIDILEFDPSLFKISKEGRNLIVTLNTEVKDADNYEISNISLSENEEPEFKIVHEQREALSQSITFDWDKIIQKLKKELSFYVNINWFGLDFDLEEALRQFRSLLEHSENVNLSSHIPQDLYEYWYCSTSQFDRYKYFSELATCYEAILREINPLVKNDKIHGLWDISEKYFPELNRILVNKEGRGIKKAARDLYLNRNKIAHGEYVEMTSLEEAQKIINYIALYVFTINTKGTFKINP